MRRSERMTDCEVFWHVFSSLLLLCLLDLAHYTVPTGWCVEAYYTSSLHSSFHLQPTFLPSLFHFCVHRAHPTSVLSVLLFSGTILQSHQISFLFFLWITMLGTWQRCKVAGGETCNIGVNYMSSKTQQRKSNRLFFRWKSKLSWMLVFKVLINLFFFFFWFSVRLWSICYF